MKKGQRKEKKEKSDKVKQRDYKATEKAERLSQTVQQEKHSSQVCTRVQVT